MGTVAVEIFHTRLTIREDGNGASVQALATEVDARIQPLSTTPPRRSPLRAIRIKRIANRVKL